MWVFTSVFGRCQVTKLPWSVEHKVHKNDEELLLLALGPLRLFVNPHWKSFLINEEKRHLGAEA